MAVHTQHCGHAATRWARRARLWFLLSAVPLAWGCEGESGGTAEVIQPSDAGVSSPDGDASGPGGGLDASAPSSPDDAGAEADGDATTAGLDVGTAPDAGAEPPPDAAVPDAAPDPPDAAPDPVLCADWAALDPTERPDAVHVHLHDRYAPIVPEPNLGGTIDRYTTARRLMFTEVEWRDGAYEAIYTGERVDAPEREEPDNRVMNAEHTWPRSRMDPDEEGALYEHQQSDIHNLLPAISEVNSARGSLPFGDPVSQLDRSFAPAEIGADASGRFVFRPRAERRGDVARVLFYFSIRWGLDLDDGQEATLRAWADADPVDDRERRRNDAVEAIQGNRNPFVDCPGLAARIPDFAPFEIEDTADALPFP